MKEKSEGYLVAAEKSVAAFAKAQTEENYFGAVHDFVFEVMATRRRLSEVNMDPSGIPHYRKDVAEALARDNREHPMTWAELKAQSERLHRQMVARELEMLGILQDPKPDNDS